MSPAQARALLKSAGLIPADLARAMILLGDTRLPETVQRGVNHVLARDREMFVPASWAALVRMLAVVGMEGIEIAMREWVAERTGLEGAEREKNLAIRNLFR